MSETEYRATFAWLEQVGLISMITETAQSLGHASATELDAALEKIDTRYMEIWQTEAGLKTYGQAVADVMKSRTDEGDAFRHERRGMAGFLQRRFLLRSARAGEVHGYPGRMGL